MIKTMLFLFIITLSSLCYGYELLIIQAVSQSKNTFITRNGKKDGVFVGKKGTFTANNMSLLAKANSVNREFTHWKILNEQATLPFKKGDIVTYYDAEEFLWTLNPEEVRRKFISSENFETKHGIEAHVGLISGLKETVSNSEATSIRGGIQGEILYQREMGDDFSWASGLRLATEVINLDAATLTNNKFLASFEIRYMFAPIRIWNNMRFGASVGLGYGQSETSSESSQSSGIVQILPMTKVLADIPMNSKNTFILEAAFESLNIVEDFEDGTQQETEATNIRFGAGIRHQF